MRPIPWYVRLGIDVTIFTVPILFLASNIFHLLLQVIQDWVHISLTIEEENTEEEVNKRFDSTIDFDEI